MAKNYYCLVAGLREFTREGEHKGFDPASVQAEIDEGIGRKDREKVALLRTYHDIGNIVNLKASRAQFSPLGNFGRAELEEEAVRPVRLPRFVREVLEAYADPEDTDYEEIDRSKTLERSLMEAYYRACAASKSRFLREWGEFDRNLRNVCAALTARRLGIPVPQVLVGGGYVAESLARSSAADFGLKGEVGYLDRVIAAVADEENLLEKEHRIDSLRWEMSEELTTFDYFNIEFILGYLVRVGIVSRWMSLDRERGQEMFARLLASLGGAELIGRAESTNE